LKKYLTESACKNWNLFLYNGRYGEPYLIPQDHGLAMRRTMAKLESPDGYGVKNSREKSVSISM
jgi:hypothetical protein